VSAVSMQVQYSLGRHRAGSRRAAVQNTPYRLRLEPTPDTAQEKVVPMHSRPLRDATPADCEVPVPVRSKSGAGSAWPTAAAERVDAKARLSRLAKTLESDVIPRLVGAHGKPAASTDVQLSPGEVAAFVQLLRDGSDAELAAAVSALHRRGLAVDGVFLDLFAPAARHLGELWETDRCDFSTVTICLGRLQRLLREWSPSFGNEVEHPANGRRILLAQHPDEQHSFGLSMVAEFFRREGWEVLGGVGGAVPDPSAQVSREWFDAVGFSIGSETRIDWLRERITRLRKATRNRSVVVLVGGPLFVMQPAWAQSVGADASGHEGGKAPKLAEDLLTARYGRR
jgi:methanogenic corrinoid protein MtbC1